MVKNHLTEGSKGTKLSQPEDADIFSLKFEWNRQVREGEGMVHESIILSMQGRKGHIFRIWDVGHSGNKPFGLVNLTLGFI